MGTYIVGALVLWAVVMAARKVYADRKSGGCSSCPSRCECSHAHADDLE